MKGTVKKRRRDLVGSLGGRVIDTIEKRSANAEVPTLVICPNSYSQECPTGARHLLPTRRIVRERWLDRIDGSDPHASLPDFKPDAVYAQVREIRDPRSYFYRALPDADLVSQRNEVWKALREDWTPSA